MNCKSFHLAVPLLVAAIGMPVYSEETPVGLWRTYDDGDGLPASLVQIDERNGRLEGRIVRILPRPGHEVDAKCTKCAGENKDQPITGMKILGEMRRNGDEYVGGWIFDPDSGTSYRCKLALSDGKLRVRGFVGFSLFGRTQTWIREK